MARPRAASRPRRVRGVLERALLGPLMSLVAYIVERRLAKAIERSSGRATRATDEGEGS